MYYQIPLCAQYTPMAKVRVGTMQPLVELLEKVVLCYRRQIPSFLVPSSFYGPNGKM